jgi:hypothetical protein
MANFLRPKSSSILTAPHAAMRRAAITSKECAGRIFGKGKIRDIANDAAVERFPGMDRQ